MEIALCLGRVSRADCPEWARAEGGVRFLGDVLFSVRGGLACSAVVGTEELGVSGVGWWQSVGGECVGWPGDASDMPGKGGQDSLVRTMMVYAPGRQVGFQQSER